MKEVAIVYHYFAHYRLPILKELALDNEINFQFISDIVSENNIKTVDFASEQSLAGKHIKVRNIWLYRFLWQSDVIGILLSKKFDAVIFLGEDRTISTWFAMVLMRMKGVKVYLWSHGLYGRETYIRKKMRVLFNRLANGIFLYNNRAKQLMIKENIPSDKLDVIYNSLDFKEIEKYRLLQLNNDVQKNKLTFINPDLPTAFCISRINASKRIDLLIKAIFLLHNRGFLINCFIIGDGKEEVQKLKALINDLDLNNYVEFTGALYTEKDISECIMASDICVCPGAIGLTAIHSLSYGVPVITHNNFAYQGPEFEAITPKVTGDFFAEGDVQDLADKIKECIIIRKSNLNASVENCLSVVREFYNPNYQLQVFKKTLLQQR